MRSWVAVASTLVALAGALVAPAAHAASYRYWSYWTAAGGSWEFSAVGAGSRVPDDGDVEGWRFATSGVVGDEPPRTPPAFADICVGPDPAPEAKRVALVVDPGEAADAPPGEQPAGAWATCIEVPLEATGYDVLRAAAQVRTDRGLICAINDFPARECAVAVADAAPAADAEPAGDAAPASDAPAASDAGQADVGASDAASLSGTATPAEPEGSTTAPATDAPTADPTATASPSATRTATPQAPTPTVSVSLITTPPSSGSKGGGGSTAGIIVALVLAAVGVLGAAALLRSRRGEP